MGSLTKKYISRPVERISQNKYISPIITLNPVTGPYVIGKNILESRAASRQQQHEDEQMAREMAQETSAIGQEELEKYRSGELTEGQKATIQKQTDIQKAQLRQALASGGISSSSMRATEEGSINQYGASLAAKFSEQHWDAAMKILGLSTSAQNTLHQMSRENMQENIQLYSGLMSLIGTGVGAWVGSSGGGTEKSTEGTDTSDHVSENLVP